MQASLKLHPRNSQYMTMALCDSPPTENTPTKMPKFNRDELNDSHSTHAKIIQTAFDCPLLDSVLEQSAFQYRNQQKQCEQCLEWKRWATLQQQTLLAVEKKLIEKQTTLGLLVGALYKEIEKKDRVIEEYRIQLEAMESQRTTLNKQMQQLQLDFTSRHRKIDQQTCMTPIKSKQTDACMEIQLGSLSRQTRREFADRKDVGKASTIGGKTEGWMTTNSKILKDTADRRCRADEEKTLFQNQILKEYNATLLQRLQASHIKKYF